MGKNYMTKEWKLEPFSPHTDSLATGNFSYLMDDDNLYITWYGGPQASMVGIKGNIVLINFSGHPEIYKRMLDPDPQNKGRIVQANVMRQTSTPNDHVLIYERTTNIITIGGKQPFTTAMNYGVNIVIPIKKPEVVRVQQIRYMDYFLDRGGLVGNAVDNDRFLTDRINTLVYLKTKWSANGTQLTSMSNTGFIAYAVQDSFPYLLKNNDFLNVSDIYNLFHNEDLQEKGIDQLWWSGTPAEFTKTYTNMQADLLKPQSHQEYTGFDKQIIIVGDSNFSDENSAIGLIWRGKIMAVTVDDGLHEYAPDEFFNLFDVTPTNVAIIRII